MRQDAPRAQRRPKVLRHHGDERVDDWYWLRDRDDPAVIEYLEAENAFTKAALASIEGLRSRIFSEIKRRVRETDVSAPVRKGAWEYYTRTIEGHDYAVHCRCPVGAGGAIDPDAAPGTTPGEEVLIDENARAERHEYFALRGLAVSPDQKRLAFAVDVTGGERSVLRFRDLAGATDLADEIPDVYYGLAWANDDTTVFYVRPDESMRPWQVWRHTLGTPVADDALVYQEDDDRFYLHVDRSRTDVFVIITAESKLTSEVRLVDANDPGAPARLITPREHGTEYHVEHHRDDEQGDRLFILTNADGAENFKLMVASLAAPGRESWTEVIGHRADVRLESVDAFAAHLVLAERADGLEQLRVRRIADGADHTIAMPDEVYSAWVGANPEFASRTLRFGYTSLAVPVRDVDYDLDDRSSVVVKQQDVADYNADEYETWREWATAEDGTRVPISLVGRRGRATEPAPLVIYGYGAYEISIDPTFSVSRVSLLERGVLYAIAHVRGGGELGRRWYEDGKLERKTNTFRDFTACAAHLVATGVTAPDRLVARGGSAGGLLMGVVANLRPDLFRAIVAEVPFVDCLTTMLDERLPLTITEWEEWGNPDASPAIYDAMKAYSPYDNVGAHAYPALLVTAGLNDPRVQYWEPAKWVAKLRATAKSEAPIYLRTELGAGHHGPSGRYDAWREEAFVLAFVLDQLGIRG
jgi:oligopeptidase B